MRHLTRRGTSLLELLTVLTLLGVTGTITVALVTGAGRAARRAATHLIAERTTHSLSALLRHDLRGNTSTDLVVASPTVVYLDRPVGEVPVCGGSGTMLQLRRSAWTGQRSPQPGRDQLRLLAAPSAGTWTTATLLDIGSGSCPDGAAAWRATVSHAPAAASHARVVEPARVAAYAGAGGRWLGLAGPGDPMQPFAGPLATGGLTLALSGGALTVALTPAGGIPRMLVFPMVTP